MDPLLFIVLMVPVALAMPVLGAGIARLIDRRR